ncbi:MCT family MFS transporter [Aspergillus saccharolyticus JOP 1030-1]|uniref:MFS general substrate transporter n=1 Tax=Aspergillus saccharolyticus JOP 1030-1 TaxID=1450539 RepID=A0A318ZSW9_9EURO|nr:MFS general substrate transporter [Aspergillus saccharolyticus JOP 1030-1]PYH49795.1 MFS general substrate transporter [Aspergillus saccharolyticus JOP 1030-1]
MLLNNPKQHQAPDAQFTDRQRPSAKSQAKSIVNPAEKSQPDCSPGSQLVHDCPPDGGVVAWSVVLGAWCAMFCSFGWINSIGTFQTYYETTLLPQYPPSTIAWIPSLEVFFMFFMGPLVGTLSDTVGARLVILAGSTLHVFGLLMTSLSTQYYQILLSQGICSAMGICAIFQPSMSVIPSWFRRRRGAAYGIIASGSSVGGIVFPIMTRRLVERVGFAWAMRVAAFLILGLLVVTCLTVRSREYASVADGEEKEELKKKPGMTRETMLRPWREVKMRFLVAGFVLLTFGIYIPTNFVETAAIASGMREGLAQYVVPILNAGSLIGRMAAGFLSDRVGTYNIFLLVCTLTGILILGLWMPATTNAENIVFAVLYGVTSGAYFSLPPALVAKLAPLPEMGYWTGVLYLFSSIGGLTTNPIAGAILARDQGSYTGMKVFSGLLLLAGTMLVLVTRVRQTGWHVRAKF